MFFTYIPNVYFKGIIEKDDKRYVEIDNYYYIQSLQPHFEEPEITGKGGYLVYGHAYLSSSSLAIPAKQGGSKEEKEDQNILSYYKKVEL